MSAARRIFVVVAFVGTTLAAAEDSRPKIGLALGGGGARGCAHVGVLRVLERMNIPIDYIAGTSMGAAIAGLYASGMTADEIDRELIKVDWRDALTDRTRYKDLSFRRKEDETRYLTALEAGLRGSHVLLPRGLRSAQKLRFLMQTYLIPVAGVRDFNKLPIPFRAVAADMETGQAVVLDHGDLGDAIRASMSIPGVFSPSEYEGKLLVDGGIADNIPVDVVRAMGADIVIAIDVGSPLLSREQIGSLFSVTSQVLTILTRQNTQKQIAAADLVIVPPLSRFGTLQFQEVVQIIAAGEEEAERQRAKLERYSVTPVQYAALLAARPRPDSANRKINYLGVEGSRRVDQRIIRKRMLTRPGQPLDAERLRHDVTRLYGLDDFEQVTFGLRDDEGQRGLVLTLKDKPWGPTYLRASLFLEDDLRGDSSYSVTVSATKTRINPLGAEWRNDIRIGGEQGFATEFYQPLDFAGRFFVAPGAQIMKTKLALWEEGHHVANLGLQLNTAWLDLGLAFGEWGEMRTGLLRGRANVSLDTGVPQSLPITRLDLGAVRSIVRIIRTDSPTIPHEGANFGATAYVSRRSLGAGADYTKVHAEGATFSTIRRQTFFVALAGGSNLGTQLPVYDEFPLGGLLALGGFAPGQLHGQQYALLSGGTYYRIRNLSSELGEGVYAGALFEVGNAWPAGVRRSLSDLHRSVTAVIGAQTLIGPVIVGYGRAETGDDRFYLTIGKTF